MDGMPHPGKEQRVFSCSGVQLEDMAVGIEVTKDMFPHPFSFVADDGACGIEVVKKRRLPVESG
jgi:hypothetical protein